MTDVLTGALSLLLTLNPPQGLLPASVEKTNGSLVMSTNDPLAIEFQALLKADDEATDTVDKWIEALPDGAEVSPELKKQIDAHQDKVIRRYEAFLVKYPAHAPAVIAYGSFLGDIGDELGMVTKWEKARLMDPSSPAVWNNLAGHYAHQGPIEKGFTYMEKAIELNPKEAQYWHSLGTITFLFRLDAQKHFKTNEQGVFEKAFQFYDRALALRPFDFKLATDVAQTWYGVRTLPAQSTEIARQTEVKIVESGLKAWTNAFRLASNDLEKEGIRLHFARWQIRSGRWAEARTNLDLVLDPSHAALKSRLDQNWTAKQSTNSSPQL